MTFVHSMKFNQKLCEILHEDPNKVRSIRIVANANEAAKVIVTRYLDEEDVEEVTRVITDAVISSPAVESV